MIHRGGLEVFPRLIAAEHQHPFTAGCVKSGITELDNLLGGGPALGTSTLLMGPAGSGKSTIAVQYAVAAAERGDHSVIFAFDESLAVLEARTAGLGIKFREGAASGHVALHQIDPAEMSAGEFAWRVRHAVEVDHARLIVIDSLNGYMNSMPEEQFLTAQLHELLTYLGHRGVTTLMVVAQSGLMGTNVQAPVDASYLADSVVLFRYFEHEGRVKKAISVLKKRTGPHEESIRELRFDRSGIRLSQPLAKFQGILTGVPIAVKPEGTARSGAVEV
jgi:circadian clock protein KaiC